VSREEKFKKFYADFVQFFKSHYSLQDNETLSKKIYNVNVRIIGGKEVCMEFYVNDIMSEDVIAVKEYQPIRDLIRIFAQQNITGVPVIDKDEYIVGVVSASDVLKNENSHTFYVEPFLKNFRRNLFENAKFLDRPVSEIMTKDLFTIGPDETIHKMARIMYEKNIHRLLVTRNNRLLGIVTTFDLLKLLAAAEDKVSI